MVGVIHSSFIFFFSLRVAFGNCNGLAVVDFIQKTVLLSMGTIDLYRSSDIYQRQPRSPRKNKQFIAGRR